MHPATSARSRRTRTLVLALSLVPLIACSNSKKGGGSVEPAGIDEGTSYDTDSFSYADPHAPDFHPLGSERFVATERGELILVTANAGQPDGDSWHRDDLSTGGVWTQGGPWTSDLFEATSAVLGDVDGDGRPEPIYAGVEHDETETRTSLRIGQPDAHGGALGLDHVVRVLLHPVPVADTVADVQVTAADLDGDGADELVVTEHDPVTMTTSMRGLRVVDAVAGPTVEELFAFTYTTVDGIWVSAGQFDADPGLELLASHRQGWGLASYLHHDLALGCTEYAEFLNSTAVRDLQPVVGSFDGEDELDEVVYLDYLEGAGSSTWFGLAVVDVLADGTYQKVAETSYQDDLLWDGQLGGGLLVCDRDLDGYDEVVWLGGARGPGTVGDVRLHRWEPLSTAGWEFEVFPLLSGTPFLEGAVSMAAGSVAMIDEDGGGQFSLLASYREASAASTLWVHSVQPDDTVQSTSLAGAYKDHVFLCGGDFDDDGLRLEYVGKHLELPAPIPMVLLAAPPTKVGIAQNLDGSGSTYSVSDSTSTALEVAIGASVSVSAGFEVEDVFGLSGVSGSTTLQAAVEKSLGIETTLTTSKSFSGSYDRDSLVFSGVLHHVYDYLVVAAPEPAAVGSTVTINVPVDSRVYKWSLGFYNDQVGVDDQIPAGVLGHTIGDPASYPDAAALNAKLEDNGGPYEGWPGTSTVVGEGVSTNGIGLEIATATTTGDAHSFSVENSLEIKAGGATAGVTVGLFGSEVYTVTVSESTAYEGLIGDIAGDDWQDWFYEVGMVVYTRDEPGDLPYQVLQYWTEPLGSQYP